MVDRGRRRTLSRGALPGHRSASRPRARDPQPDGWQPAVHGDRGGRPRARSMDRSRWRWMEGEPRRRAGRGRRAAQPGPDGRAAVRRARRRRSGCTFIGLAAPGGAGALPAGPYLLGTIDAAHDGSRGPAECRRRSCNAACPTGRAPAPPGAWPAQGTRGPGRLATSPRGRSSARGRSATARPRRRGARCARSAGRSRGSPPAGPSARSARPGGSSCPVR